MCGIAGLFDPSGYITPSRETLERMGTAIAHRGPDGSGIHISQGVGLVHRRLSIIDLGGGGQPLYSPDKQRVIVFNGEIYNFLELRAQLAAAGRQFQTNSDTEVVLAAWEQWGVEAPKYLRGMFAFAIWDMQSRELFFARDRFGIKPLYIARLRDGLVGFASELKALLVLKDQLPRQLRDDAIIDYLALGYIPEPKTLLQSVDRLAPGHSVLIHQGSDRWQVRRYWDLSFGSGEGVKGSEEDILRELQDRLDESVKAHLIADVPVSAFLSGGVDSSAVVLSAGSAVGGDLTAYSVSFETKEHDESPYARQVAAIAGVKHEILPVQLAGFTRIPQILALYDEPFADSSAVPTFELCRAVAQHCKVALSGDGGDEAFVGYPWYLTHLKRDRYVRSVPGVMRGATAVGATALDSFATALGIRVPGLRFLRSGGKDVAAGYFATQQLAPWMPIRDVVHKNLKSRVDSYSTVDLFREVMSSAPSDDPVHRAQYLDFKMYLPGDILTKVDRASMASSLEVRVPLIDHVLIDWVLSLGSHRLLSGGAKGLLRKSLQSRLPTDILNRRKQGFSVPLRDWFVRRLCSDVEAVASTQSPLWDVLDRTVVMNISRAHQAQRMDASSLLWAVLALDVSLKGLLAGA